MTTNNDACNVDDKPMSFQDEYDKYVKDVYELLNDENRTLDTDVEDVLKDSLRVMDKYRHDMQELELYQKKFTPESPLNVEMSELKKCLIGQCRCGQLLLQKRDICCPKCHQFVDWNIYG
jgi:hypothetical protein